MDNILDYSLGELKLWMKKNGEKEFRAAQVFNWIYKNNLNFSDMENIPMTTRNKLKNSFTIDIPITKYIQNSKDGNTSKFLFEYTDGSLVETVVMSYNYGNSICVSTQVGCKMGCKFCASTLSGLVRNLTSGEILAQIIKAEIDTGKRISNVVLMGSGEPLDNFENVIKFIELVNSEYGLNIGARHITLSTCGIVPMIYRLSEQNLQITLAISLHAPNDQIRAITMPIASKYSIEELIVSCRDYINKTNRRITFEYALIKDINDSEENARELARLLKTILCHVNLIPINQVKERNLVKPSIEKINLFCNILNSSGIETTVRKEMGTDIDAACGQLRRRYNEKSDELSGV